MREREEGGVVREDGRVLDVADKVMAGPGGGRVDVQSGQICSVYHKQGFNVGAMRLVVGCDHHMP